MSNKPDRLTAMQQIIDAVQQEFPLYQQDTFVCGPNIPVSAARKN